MGDKLGQVNAMENGRSVVETRTSMVDGTSPADANVNGRTKEDQDRLAAALALTDLVRVSSSSTIPSSNIVGNIKRQQNGLQHIPVQAMPQQPVRHGTLGHTVAMPKHAIANQSTLSNIDKGGNLNRQIMSINEEKKKAGRPKKSAQEKSRVSKSRTIAQYYLQGASDTSSANAKIRNEAAVTIQQNDDTASVSVANNRPMHIVKGEGQETLVHAQSGVKYENGALMKPHDSHHVRLPTANASQAHVIGYKVVTSTNTSNMGQILQVRHVLPATMTTANRGVARPSVHTSGQIIGTRPNSQYILQQVVPSAPRASAPQTIIAINQASVAGHKKTTKAAGTSPNSSSADFTSVDISTLNLPTNVPMAAPLLNTTNESSKPDSRRRISPKNKRQALINEKFKSRINTSQSNIVQPNRQAQLISDIALSNIEDKNKPLSVKQMISMSALSYLQPNSGPVKMPHYPPGLIGEAPGQSNTSPSQSSSKKPSLPMMISEGPPSRSSLVNLPGKSPTASGKSGANASFDDMFPLSNRNPLLPRVFHSFHPSNKQDMELQPTDLSLKKPKSQGIIKHSTESQGVDQPQDLSISKVKRGQNVGNSDILNVGQKKNEEITPLNLVVLERRRDDSRSGKTVSLPNTTSGTVTLAQPVITTDNTPVISMPVKPSTSDNQTPRSENMSTSMPPLVPGIPLPVLQSLIARQKAGVITPQIQYLPTRGTTIVDSVPAVMSTGENLQGSRVRNIGPTTTVNTQLTPIVSTQNIAKSKQVVPAADKEDRDQLKQSAPENTPGNDNNTAAVIAEKGVESNPGSKMIGACPPSRDGDMPLYNEFERNKLPPKKRKLLYQDLHNDCEPTQVKVSKFSATQDVSTLKTASGLKASDKAGDDKDTDAEPRYSYNNDKLEIGSRPPTPASGSTSPGARSTDSPVQVDPRMNLIMLRECQMAVRPDEDGDLPLHIAVVQGESGVVDRLIQMMKMLDSSVDQYNNLRQTPLHLAVITDALDIVEKLLNAGASPNLQDRKGQTSIHLCIRHKFKVGLETLIRLSKHKLELDSKNYDGLTPLHLSVQTGDVEFVNILLKAGAEVDSMDGKSGKTPLYFAAELNHDQIVRVLLENGANVSIANYSGNTPMSVANAKGYYTQVVNLLLKYGADPGSSAGGHSSANPSPTPDRSQSLVRHALKESLSSGKVFRRSNSRTSPPSSAPGTPRPRKRKGKHADAHPPSKLVRSASYDPTAARGVPVLPGSPMVAASQGAPSPLGSESCRPYSPVSSAGSPREPDTDKPRPIPPLARIDTTPGALALAAGRLSVLPGRSHIPILPHPGPQAGPPVTATRTEHHPATPTATVSRPSPPPAPVSPPPSVQSIPQMPPLEAISSSSVVSDADGRMVLTVPVEMDVNQGMPIPKQILPPVVSSPSARSSPRPLGKKDEVKKQPVTLSEAKINAPTSEEVRVRDILSPKSVKETEQSPRARTPSTEAGDKAARERKLDPECSDEESSDSFMIDESNTETSGDTSSPKVAHHSAIPQTPLEQSSPEVPAPGSEKVSK